ncbi:MAG: hypothetical protein GXO28_06745 [Methanopyri archaeon]|nr:hypothetical protein [Methanopyri archaeon]
MADDAFGYKLARTLSPLSDDTFRSVPAGPWPERVKIPDHDVLIAADAVLGAGEPGDVLLVREPGNTGYPSHGVPFEPDLLIGFVPVKTGYGPPSREMLETVKALAGEIREAILEGRGGPPDRGLRGGEALPPGRARVQGDPGGDLRR